MISPGPGEDPSKDLAGNTASIKIQNWPAEREADRMGPLPLGDAIKWSFSRDNFPFSDPTFGIFNSVSTLCYCRFGLLQYPHPAPMR
jgi:hypothetical protein